MRRAWAVETALTDNSMTTHKAQDELENPNMDDDLRTGINYKRVDKLASIQRAEARFERTQARALAEFRRLRKLRPSDAQPIQITRPDISTTGRDPSQYLKPPIEPNPSVPDSAPEPCIVIPDYPKPPEDEFDPIAA